MRGLLRGQPRRDRLSACTLLFSSNSNKPQHCHPTTFRVASVLLTGRGMAALLRAKRAVLHAHSGHPLAAAGVLPLLEFAAAGMLAPSTVVDQAYLDSSPQQVLAIQVRLIDCLLLA